MTLYYQDPQDPSNFIPIKSRTLSGEHIIARDIDALPGTVETDIGETRGFLATLAAAVTLQRVAINLDATPAANLATLAGAIATGSMKAILQAGTAVIGKVDINSVPALPSSGFGFPTTVGIAEVTLAANAVTIGAVLKADDDNTDSIYFRFVTGTTVSNGFRLRPGQFVPVAINNTNLIRCISGTASQKVHCTGS